MMSPKSKQNFNLKNFLENRHFLFLIILAIEILYLFYLIIQHRVTFHDTMVRFFIQYFFLNNAVQAGEVPQWFPYLTHGSSGYWFFSVWSCSNILFNVLMYTGKLFQQVNFITVFHLGVFVEKLVLLVGTWLLARRFYSSASTVFFVTLTVMGTSIWFNQIYFNLFLYYAIPLILYFFHQFWDTGKWKYFFLSANLFTLQMICGLLYQLPIISMVLFLYLFFYFLCDRKECLEKMKNIRWDRSSLIYVGLSILSVLLIFIISKFVLHDEIVKYTTGREVDGIVPVHIFITHYLADLVHWGELVLGISPNLDMTLYMGLFSIPLIIFGLCFNLNRKNTHIPLLIITLFLFSTGSFVSYIFYYIWPFMKYFRHIGLISPVIKLFLCFLAGFGFEAIFIKNSFQKHPKKFVLGTALSALFFLFHFLYFDNSIAYPGRFSENLLSATTDVHLLKFIPQILEPRLTYLSGVSITFFILFLLILVSFRFPNLSFSKYSRRFLILALLFHMTDICGYNYFETKMRTHSFYGLQYQTSSFQPMPFVKRRSTLPTGDTEREIILYSNLSMAGTRYWTENAFLFKDNLHNYFRVEYWLQPLDRYMRAYWNQSLDNPSVVPLGYNKYGFQMLNFPMNHPAATKIAGADEDKIQFFSTAYFMPDETSTAANITDGQYKGDILFLLPPGNKKISDTKPPSWPKSSDLSQNMRLNLPYQIQRFDANHLQVKVNVPDNQKTAWMLYSDAWHPHWKAKVNNQPVDVFKANLAYKAVPLQTGENTIHFYFGSNWFSFLHLLLAVNSLFWLIILGRLIFRIGRGLLT